MKEQERSLSALEESNGVCTRMIVRLCAAAAPDVCRFG